jgi:hypothetical protein
MQMRLLLSAAGAILLLGGHPARSQSSTGSGCGVDSFPLLFNGVANVEAQTRSGRPCQIAFGLMGTDVTAVQVMERPAHGILGASAKEENRRYIAYAPQAGFAGHDRFEVLVRWVPTGHHGAQFFNFTLIKVEMNVIK